MYKTQTCACYPSISLPLQRLRPILQLGKRSDMDTRNTAFPTQQPTNNVGLNVTSATPSDGLLPAPPNGLAYDGYNPIANNFANSTSERKFYRRGLDRQLYRSGDPSNSKYMLDLSGGGFERRPGSLALTARATMTIVVDVDFQDSNPDTLLLIETRRGLLRRLFEARALEVLQKYMDEQRYYYGVGSA